MPRDIVDQVAAVVGDILAEQVAAMTARLERMAQDIITERTARAEMTRMLEHAAVTQAETAAKVERLDPRLRDLGEGLAELRGRAAMLARMEGPAGPRGETGPAGADGRIEAPELRCEPTADPRRFNVILRVAGGVEARAELVLPVPIYQGVWQAGVDYQRGDGVTMDGSFWIALADTAARPGSPSGDKAWRLAVKRGRDAREAAA
jgi:hypothetical protein